MPNWVVELIGLYIGAAAAGIPAWWRYLRGVDTSKVPFSATFNWMFWIWARRRWPYAVLAAAAAVAAVGAIARDWAITRYGWDRETVETLTGQALLGAVMSYGMARLSAEAAADDRTRHPGTGGLGKRAEPS